MIQKRFITMRAHSWLCVAQAPMDETMCHSDLAWYLTHTEQHQSEYTSVEDFNSISYVIGRERFEAPGNIITQLFTILRLLLFHTAFKNPTMVTAI